jgi:hypothetical protein
MNKLTLIICAITLLWLVWTTFDTEEVKVKNNSHQATDLITPYKLSKDLLAVEEEWLLLQKNVDLAALEKLAMKNKNKNKNNPLNERLLSIGDNNYRLIGVFLSDKQPFILIKQINNQTAKKNADSSNGLLKVILGDEINSGTILTHITSNSITLTTNQTAIEYKLFERSINETS